MRREGQKETDVPGILSEFCYSQYELGFRSLDLYSSSRSHSNIRSVEFLSISAATDPSFLLKYTETVLLRVSFWFELAAQDNRSGDDDFDDKLKAYP